MKNKITKQKKPVKIASPKPPEELSPEGKKGLINYLRKTGQLKENDLSLSPEDKQNLMDYLSKTGQLKG